MKFSKHSLLELTFGDDADGLTLVEDEIVDTSRWSEIRYLVFTDGEKHYGISYSKGLTEMQDERPFQYEPDEIECKEVRPVDVTVRKWVTVD